MSETGRNSPLDFLAQASLAFHDNTEHPPLSKWSTKSGGKERITVVPGPQCPSIRLHKGNGRLPAFDLSKPFAKKCRNRECNNLCGQEGKPRSIYCSKRCQSREQNLRQGRIKNARSPTKLNTPPKQPSTPSTPNYSAIALTQPQEHESPNSSPVMTASPAPSSPLSMGTHSHSTSPNFLATSPSPSPIPMLGTARTPSPLLMPPSMHSSAFASLTPSPLAMPRLGITPSPHPSPSPVSLTLESSSFSPIPMSSSIPNPQGISTPIFLPKPTQSAPKAGPVPMSPSAGSPPTLQGASFSPTSSFKRRSVDEINGGDHANSDMDNLTLAPILSS